MLASELRDAAVDGIQTPAQLDGRQAREPQLAPSNVVVAVACATDGPPPAGSGWARGALPSPQATR
jgi:hypothetical protein